MAKDTGTKKDESMPKQEFEDKEYQELFYEYNGNHLEAMFKYCFIHNIHYSEDVLRSLILKKVGAAEALPQSYLEVLHTIPKLEEVDFFGQLRRNNFEKIYAVDSKINSLDEETRKNRMSVIDILAYDPFKDDDVEDMPQLYRDMAGMISEGMRKDVAKTKAALSIVRSYNNLERYQRKINEIMKSGAVDEDTQKQLDQLIKVQKTLQDSINQTAEKNNFTQKGMDNTGKGNLSDVMRKVEENGIDEGITNFYDIATSKSIEEVANISFKAQLNQIGLTKTDYADIIKEQSKIVKESQKEMRQLKEALRLAKEKIVKQELLEELARDYRNKGIDEDEIDEFIQREIKMYEDDIR